MAKLFLLKVWKPIVLASAAVGVAYGTNTWDKFSKPLHILNRNDEDLRQLFGKMDEDRSGYLDEQELKHAFEKEGVKISELSLKSMILAADEDHDGKISLDEFLHICHKIQHREGLRKAPPIEIKAKPFNVPQETRIDEVPHKHKDIVPIIKPINSMPGQFPKKSDESSQH